jgi:hypothetical protein
MKTRFCRRYLGYALSISLLFALIGTGTVFAAGVVGNGTLASCDENALDTALAGGGMVTFNCGASPTTITVTNTKIISTDTTIDGGNWITISGGDAVRVFYVNAGITLNINNLTVAHGFGVPNISPTGGGALVNNGGTVHIANSTFTDNNDGGGYQGGAIVNFFSSTLTVNNSTFTNNTAFGQPGAGASSGAIINYGTLSITDSAFSNNASNAAGVTQNVGGTMTVSGSVFSNNTTVVPPGATQSPGGGVFLNGVGSTLTVTNSAFSNNTANSDGLDGGGAIYNQSTANIVDSTFVNNSTNANGGAIANGIGGNSYLTLANDTFSGNSAGDRGGAIFNGYTLANDLLANTTITNVTFFNNSASTGGTIYTDVGTVALSNTIVSNSISGENCSGSITSNGNNLDSQNTCGFTASGDLVNTDPLLGSVKDNGGPTETMALSANSPAIDAGNNTNCAASPVNNVDQRGVTRSFDGDRNGISVCDIGAFEASSIVGIGTAASCNEAALDAALELAGTVTFNCGSLPVTITVTSTKEISKNTAIDGGGKITLSGQNSFQVLRLDFGTALNLNNLTIADGFSGQNGGLTVLQGGNATITNSIFSGNVGFDAGAITNFGTVNVSGSTFYTNGAFTMSQVGGIKSFGSLTVVNSTFSSNRGSEGGAIHNNGGTVNVINTTFSDNSVNGVGGAIFNTSQGMPTSGILNITNSTFSGNSAIAQGGGIYNTLGTIVNIINSTFSGNFSANGGAIFTSSGTVLVSNTIVANSQSGGNCSGIITSKGHNLSSDKACSKYFKAAGDINNINPLLGPLANNGGLTFTMALITGSPAIDAGDAKICSTAPVSNLDQRGVARPLNGDGKGQAICDIGAFEAPTVTKPH